MAMEYLFFVGTLGSGGAERVISLLSQKLVRIPGNKVTIITYYECIPFYQLDERVNIINLERKTGTKNIFRNLMCLRKLFKKSEGVVLSFLASFNILAILAHTGLKVPIIVADRSDPSKVPQNRLFRILRNFLYLFADIIIVQTEQNKQYFSKAIQKKSSVIYNPVALGDKAGLALRTQKRHQIVSVARLLPLKNQKMLVDAFSQISDEFPDYEVVIYGEGPERENLERYIAGKNLTARFRLPGNVTDVIDRISEAELFVLSSNYEGMPNALIEAMCVGLPVISTKVSGATDLIKDGVNGRLVSVGNVDELAGAMKQTLESESQREKYGIEAIKLNTLLETDDILQEWMNAIKKCIEKGCQ